MKFALALVALAMVAAVNAMPTPGTTLGDQGMQTVENEQIDLNKMGKAAHDLDVVRQQLQNFAAESEVIKLATEAMTTAMDKSTYEDTTYIHNT